MSDSDLLQFAPFSSALDAGFWYQLSKKKLDVYKLGTEPIDICGFYSNGEISGMPPIANIDYTSFSEDLQVPPKAFPLKGLVLNTNTLEEFKKLDKKDFLQSAGEKIWDLIQGETVLENPSLLQQLCCLTFADLKKYHFYYWVAFPAITYPEVFLQGPPKKIQDYFTENQVQRLLEGYDGLLQTSKTGFLVHLPPDGAVKVLDLKYYNTVEEKPGKVLLGFADPSALPSNPGWPLRNLLTMVALKWSKVTVWDVICFRDIWKDGARTCDHSIVLSVKLETGDMPEGCPKVVGWEKNKNKLVPRMVDMSANMDPTKLADSSVDLNLKLMKWRLLPELDLDVIKHTKCLLLGSGTLGCNVARCLTGWGIRKITFVDNSHVSFSNPVRQSLFNFEDCLNGGKPKAQAAAEAVKRIFPGVESEGRILNVPMPGHAVSDKSLEVVCKEVSELEELIESHDVIFLLTDTRESRWLPTVIGAHKQKIVMNTALGFDTFLVMRHGTRVQNGPEIDSTDTWKTLSGNKLGCYFCNDVVAPGDSSRDRTLDQQCTVTRPGASYMAASLAVEIMVSILQHPMRASAPATVKTEEDDEVRSQCLTPLGIVPHQIRGHIYRYENILHLSKAFDSCIACSPLVLEKYGTEGFDFLLKVFNEPNYLEDLTGLTDLVNNIDYDEIDEFGDDDSI